MVFMHMDFQQTPQVFPISLLTVRGTIYETKVKSSTIFSGLKFPYVYITTRHLALVYFCILYVFSIKAIYLSCYYTTVPLDVAYGI